MAGRLLKMAQVVEKMNMGESTIWAKIAKGEFPEGLPVGKRGRRWEEEALDEYIATIRSGKEWRKDPPKPDDDIWDVIHAVLKMANEPTRISRSRRTIVHGELAPFVARTGRVVDLDRREEKGAPRGANSRRAKKV